MSAVAAVERLTGTAREVPLGSRIGFAVMVVGIALDLVAHLGLGVPHEHGGATGPELSAHLVVFAGMALVLIGVVIDGVRPGRRPGGNVHKGR
jgi:hypothetical protein